MGAADELLRAFARWSAEVRHNEAAASRSRQRWLAQQATETATFRGTLVDLAEAGNPVNVATASHRLGGRLVGVGPDLCVVEEPARITVVDLGCVVAVTPQGAAPVAAAGDRATAVELTFAEALATLAADLTPVRLGLRGGETLSGDLVAAGEDVVTLRLAANPPRMTYVPGAAVEAFSLR